MNSDTKNVVIVVLAVALLVVTYMWITEKRSADPVRNAAIQLDEHKSKVASACAKTETEADKASCNTALDELSTFLSQLGKLSQ